MKKFDTDFAVGEFSRRHALRRARRRKPWFAGVCAAFLLFLGLWFSGIFAGFPGVSQAAPDPGARRPGKLSIREVLAKIDELSPTVDGEGRLVQPSGDFNVRYTLDPALQQRAQKVFSRYKVPYGAVVAIEPQTGRVLAMTGYSAQEPDAKGLTMRATYPAASLIKLVTAAAALTTGEVKAETRFRYEGSPYKLHKRKISAKNKWRENNVSTLSDALGQSNNVVFGKIGVDVVGPDKLENALDVFFFNRPIPFDFPLQISSATVPGERYPLARTSAGFGDVYISPLHAAMLAAAIANGGVMMKPYVVDSVSDADGDLLFANAPQPLGRTVEESVARTLASMMENTIRKGTSTKTFYRHARKLVNRIGVAGKTGSLTGDDPPGRYEWFVGFAPTEKPTIAVAALVVNQGDLWHIKGTYTAAAVLNEHFGL